MVLLYKTSACKWLYWLFPLRLFFSMVTWAFEVINSMKKILSLGLAVTMAMAALPTAFAAETQDYTLGSQVSVIGNAASEYEIKVPARLEAGGAAGNVVATGTWRSSEILVVTAADEVEVTEEATGAKTMVPVVFDGIEAVGNDLATMSISKAVSVEKGDVLFGTWAGIVTYDVELIAPKTLTIDGKPYNFLADMSLEDWVNSKYNTDGYKVVTKDGKEYVANANETGYICYPSGNSNYIQQASAEIRAPYEYVCSATYN